MAGRVVVILVAVALLSVAPVARATAGPRLIGEPAVENQFPDALLFSLEVESDAPIRDIRLRYTFVPDNRPASAQADFEPGVRVKATFALRSGTSRLYIPPGKTVRYFWEVRDNAGGELRTEERETAFDDKRFKWQQVTDGNVNLFYYRGSPRDAEIMVHVANETIVNASKLMGTAFDFPIKMWVYANQRDFQIALAHSSVTSDPGVLGQAHSPDTFIMVADRMGSPTALDTVRHELAHLVTNQALQGGPFKDLYPAWLNEGTSVYMQSSPNDVGYVDSLDEAVRNDSVVPIRFLTAGSRARDVGLFYGQSYALVKFLIDRFGADNFARMIAEFKVNGNEDQTFRKVYGMDRDGIYREWRTSVGLPAEQGSGPSAGRPQAGGPGGATGGGGGSAVALAVGGTVILTLLTAAAVLGGLLLARRAQAGRTK